MKKALLALTLCAAAQLSVHAGSIAWSSDRAAFEAAFGGAFVVEDFTDSPHFPISTGVLNSATDLVPLFGFPILPNDIAPGVTYSTSADGEFALNIDTGGGYAGGFLDGFNVGVSGRTLAATFDAPVQSFGFDVSSFTPEFDVTILFSDASTYSQHFAVSAAGYDFFGFTSSGADIVSASIGGGLGLTGFSLDNFTYAATGNGGGGGGGATVPDSLPLLPAIASAVGVLAFVRRAGPR